MKSTVANRPILSVVIPTIGDRNQLLDRAVLSATRAWNTGEVEVIIVLNRNLSALPLLIEKYKNTSGVQVIMSDPPGVSIARNVGLEKAASQLVRFLDDDDYLYETAAVKQCKKLLDSDADFSSFAIEIIDERGIKSGRRQPIQTDDPVVGLAASNRLQLPLSFVYKHSFLEGRKWDESNSLAEDTSWLLSLLASRECRWQHSSEVVGVWYQHSKSRLSRLYSSSESAIAVADSLLRLLPYSGGVTEERKCAIADGLWACIIAGFKFKPVYWTKISLTLRQFAPLSIPDSRFYKLLWSLKVSPVVGNWILLPFFLALRMYRSLRYGQ